MSNEVCTIARKRRVGSSTIKSVLIYMADSASDDGSGIWMSKKNMADDLEMTKRSVQRSINILTEMAIVEERGKKKCRNGFTIEYAINLEALLALKSTRDTQSRVTHSHLTGDTQSPHGVTHSHPNLPLTILEPLIDKSNTDVLPKNAQKPDFKKAFDMWNSFAQEHSLSKALKLTSPRAAKLKARLKDCGGLGGWADALAQIKKSSFLCGDNKSGWRADLDFVLQEKSFTKLVEGGYADRRPPQHETMIDFMNEELERIECEQSSGDYYSPQADNVGIPQIIHKQRGT